MYDWQGPGVQVLPINHRSQLTRASYVRNSTSSGINAVEFTPFNMQARDAIERTTGAALDYSNFVIVSLAGLLLSTMNLQDTLRLLLWSVDVLSLQFVINVFSKPS